jgi:hypothetical protein
MITSWWQNGKGSRRVCARLNNLAPEKMTDDKEQLTDRPNEYNWCHMCD